jgi:hypothetical protein
MATFFKYLSYLCFAAAIFLGLKNWILEPGYTGIGQIETNGLPTKESVLESKSGSNNLTPKTTLGHYFVNDTLVEGIVVYKDVFKKRKYPSKLSSMSELNIKKIENGMGYSDLLYGQYSNVGGWVKMDDVVYYDDMFPDKDDGVYLVKSSAINGIVIYKDKLRKKKYKTKISAMQEIHVSKISNGMAYTKMFITSNYDIISGWVDVQNLEFKKK